MSGEKITRRRPPFSPMPRALLRDQRVSPLAVRVWGILDSFVGQHESAWPSVAVLVREIGRSERIVRTALKELDDTGWLTKQPRPGRSTVYVLEDAPLLKTAGVADSDPGYFQPDPPAKNSRTSPAENSRQKRDPLEERPKELRLAPSARAATSNEAVPSERDADTLTRTWWEAQHPRPSMPFVAARKIVATVLERFDAATVEAALERAGPNLTRFRLDEACRGRAQSPRGAAKTDHLRTQMQRAAQGEL